jgi:5'-nucleotidase
VRVLLSNDDGIHAAGLAALAEAFAKEEVWVVAPDREQSAMSHSISLQRPLRIHAVGPRRFAVDGTPTDCIYLALNHLMKGERPDVVVSGVNHGPNVGDDVVYSGTVAAAMEAALLGVPAIAVSAVRRGREPFAFGLAAGFAAQLARQLVTQKPLPHVALLNVNVPGGETLKGYRFTRLGKRTYGNVVVEKIDPRGRNYYWIGGDEAHHEDIPGSDCNTVFDEGLAAVTPLHLDLTHDGALEMLRALVVEGYQKEPAR